MLCKRHRLVAYSIITSVVLGLSLFEAVYTFKYFYRPEFCVFFPKLIDQYGGAEIAYPRAVSAGCLFCLPALISTALYCKIGFTLLKRKKDAGRNQVLTVALLMSCVFWILISGISYLIRFLDIFADCFMVQLMICISGFYQPKAQWHCPGILINDVWEQVTFLNYLFSTFSALMNSLCLLIVCKPFWESAIALCRALCT